MIGLRSKRIISDTIIYLVLTVMVVIWLFPLVWMLLRAFDTNFSNYSKTIFPESFTMENFKNLFTGGDYDRYPYARWLLNTFLVALGSCAISTLMVLMVSFALSRLRFKARKKLMNIALILGLFPGFLSVIALYYIFNQFGLAGSTPSGDENPLSLVGLMLAYSLASGMGYYIVKGFFDTVPIAIDEAARIDGATKHRIFWQMIIPLSKPIIIYTILTSFIGPWCDFILAKVFIKNVKYYTVAIGIQQWLSTDDQIIRDHFARFCAGGMLISVPIVLLYIIMQKFYVAGITGGAAKG